MADGEVRPSLGRGGSRHGSPQREAPRCEMNARTRKVLGWLAVPPLLLAVFVIGLFVYVNATIKPLHLDPQKVSSVTHSPPSQEFAAAVVRGREAVRASLAGLNLPGLSVAVGVRGEIVWAEGFGWADIEKQLPVAPGTRFRTGGA